MKEQKQQKADLKPKIETKRIIYYALLITIASLYVAWFVNDEYIKLNETTNKYYFNFKNR